MASLFALKLEPSLGTQANFLQAFTFSIIGFTVIIQGLSAGKVANFLSVKFQDRVGWLIIGAHLLARRVASFIEQTTGHPCVLMDTNTESARQAESEGLRVLRGNAPRSNKSSTRIVTFYWQRIGFDRQSGLESVDL